ncbi:unnamed protein product, partial [Rotaria magnacalcarata]
TLAMNFRLIVEQSNHRDTGHETTAIDVETNTISK